MKDCGHECDGVAGETVCLPCLHVECGPKNAAEAITREFNATRVDLCIICLGEYGNDPCIRVCKSHIYHASCILGMLEAKWTTMSITFAFLDCPACKKPMKIDTNLPKLGPVFIKMHQFKRRIEEMAIEEASYAGLKLSPQLKDPDDPYFNDWPRLAINSCTYYECFSCKEPYFGGMINCRQTMREERNIKKENLRCNKCLSEELGFGQFSCDIHGDKFIDYKCRFCCNIALYVCFNGTHFCHSCHLKACR